MARFVDIKCDAVTEAIGRRAFTSRADIQEFLDNIPTADVVPKSSFNGFIEELELCLNKAIDSWHKERRFCSNDRQIEMIDFRNDAFKYCLYVIAELRRKYVEEGK